MSSHPEGAPDPKDLILNDGSNVNDEEYDSSQFGPLIGSDTMSELKEEKKSESFGKQSISAIGSFILNVNNIVGPAVVTYPYLYQNGNFTVN